MDERNVEDVDLLVVGGGKAGKSLAMDRFLQLTLAASEKISWTGGFGVVA
jgi:hypothetical protein